MNAALQRKPLVAALQAIKRTASHQGKLKTTAMRLVRVVPEADHLRLVYNNAVSDLKISRRVPAAFSVEPEAFPSAGTPLAFDLEDMLRLTAHLPNDLALAADESGNLRLVFENGEFHVPPVETAWLGQDWPHDDPPGTLETDALASLLWETYCFAAKDETRDAIGCVRLIRGMRGRVMAEALDGHQYVNASRPAPGLRKSLPEEGILIRRKFARQLAHLLGSGFFGEGVSLFPEWGEFKADPTCVADTRSERRQTGFILSGSLGRLAFSPAPYQFPDTMLFLEKSRGAPHVLTLDHAGALRALRLMAPLTDQYNRSVTLSLTPSGVTFFTETGFRGEYRMAADYEGELDSIAFPASVLREVIASFPGSETVRMGFTSREGPCRICVPDHDREVVLMPMKMTADHYDGGRAS